MSSISVFTSPGAAGERGEQRRALARHDVGELQPAGADLRQVLVEPLGQRRVEIGDAALAIDREEPGRRMVEIVDGVLQFLEDVLLPLELARHVGDRPDREPRLALAFAERPHPHAQPAPGLALVAADAHLLLQPAAFARRLEQAEDRLRHAGIADEHALDRPHVVGVGGLDQIEIGGIGIDHAAGGIGDQDGVARAVDQALDQRARGVPAGGAQDAGREREQQEHADHRQHGQQREDVGLRLGAADQHQADAGADQHDRDQQHEPDAAAVLAGAGAVDRRPPDVSRQLLLRHDRANLSDSARHRAILAATARRPKSRKEFAHHPAQGRRTVLSAPPATARLSRMT